MQKPPSHSASKLDQHWAGPAWALPALLALLTDPHWQPYVVFPGEPDQIKNIRTGEQIDLDAESWWPAADQLTPQIRSDVSLSSFVSAAVMGD